MRLLPPRLDRRTLLALLLLGVALPTVLWASGDAIGDERPSIDSNVTERYRSVDALTGMQTTTVRTNGTVTSRNVADVTLVPGTDRKRMRFRNASDRRYERQVSNGSTLWLHDTDANAVTVVELTGPPTDSRTAARLQRLVTAAGLTDDAGRPQSVGVSPLPVLPRHTGVAPQTDADGRYTVEFAGTDTVGGRSVHMLEIAPASNRSEARYRQRLWVDTERFYPLRKQTTWTADGTRRSVTTTYTNVTVNPGLSEDEFRPEFDDNATIRREDSPTTEWYRSRTALEVRSSLSVPKPTVPPAFELAYATRTTGRIDGVGLRYVADGRELTVAKFNYTLDVSPGERDVTVGGQPAVFDRGPTTSIAWDCDGYGYTVRGKGVATDRLTEVARSVGCRA
ncbi:LolA family protein [Haloarcula nitratireducens]|uniref:Outer membrane lipoprotein carrier protein LolA n=1 Tax=Haloarcula nitratireducens TaxID=2487749 RepID=A0AAW4PEJ7_9EURY|nr:sigma-E factor regulatory protein RseB domain-containing protein [Halomicroarcula nitratireducens]MBX0296152.1 outer membrane lipoprotein carrier protein LolA [Halomicroarcula nitratireducens]